MFTFIKCLFGIYGIITNGSKKKNEYSDYINTFPDIKVNTEPLINPPSSQNFLLTWFWVLFAIILLKIQALYLRLVCNFDFYELSLLGLEIMANPNKRLRAVLFLCLSTHHHEETLLSCLTQVPIP